MSTLMVTWSVEALDSTMSFYFADKVYQSVYGKDDLKKRIKKDMLFKLFEAAPEYIDELPTVYKKSQESFALNGVSLNGNKPNAQMTHIADSLKDYYCLDCLAEYLECSIEDLKIKIQEFKEEGCTLFL